MSDKFNICETFGKPDKCPIHSKSTQKELMSILDVCSNQYLTVKDNEMLLIKHLNVLICLLNS